MSTQEVQPGFPEGPIRFLDGYFQQWNNPDPNIAELGKYVATVCRNRFNLEGPEGMAYSIRERHKMIDNYNIEFRLMSPSLPGKLDAHLHVTGTFNPPDELAIDDSYSGIELDFWSQVQYDISNGKIIGGRSNMRDMIFANRGIRRS